MANTVSSLQQKILGLTSGRVDIMASNDEFKSTTQILRELASVWDTMTDVQQAASLEALGGKRQANILAAIITNFDTVEDAITTSEGSAGSALEENEKRLDSFQGRLNQLTSTVQTKWNEALDTELIKDAIQLMTKLVDTLDFEDSGIVDVLDWIMKGLSGIIDGLQLLTGGNFNLGTTLLAFLGANTLRKYNMWPFGDGSEANKNVETLTKEIEQLKKANEELLVDEQKTSNIFTKNKYKNQRTKNEKKIAKKEKDLAKQQAAELAEASKATPEQQEEIAESFDIKKIQSRKGGKANALKQRRAKLASQGKTEAEIAVDPKIKQYTKDIEDCDKAINDYNKTSTKKIAVETTGAGATQKSSNSTNQNTGSKAVNEKATETLNTDVKDGIDDRINSGNAIDKESQDLDENTVKKNKNAGASKNAAGGFKAMASSAGKMIAVMALMEGVMGIFDYIATAIDEAFKKPGETYEELHENFEVVNSDLSEQKSELQSLESEFDTIQDQIIEIQSLGSLSFTKQEELDKLKAQSAELERQIELQKIITQNQQGKTNEAALKAAEEYLKTSAETTKTLTETQEEAREEGEKTGKLVTDIVKVVGGAALLAGLTILTGGAATVAVIAGGVAIAGAGLAGTLTENAVVDNATADYKDDQTRIEQLNSYKTTREAFTKGVEDAAKKMDEDDSDENIEAYKAAVEALNNFDNATAESIGQMQEYISSVDYSTLDPTQKETYKKINEYINEYSLANGGSTVNAANSVLGYDEYKGEKYRIEDVTTQLKRGDITEEQAATEIEKIINGNAKLKSELEALGLSITENVVPAFTELGEKLKEDAKLMDSLDKVSAVTSAFDDLGSAVSEFREEGRASTSTLESLNEKFGDLDEFEGLYNVLATGEGNLEEEIANVANAYVGQIQALAGLTDEEEAVMVKRLESLGVLNAQEVLDARRTAQTKLEQSKLAYGIDLSNYGNAEQAKLAIASAAGLSYADITEDNIKGLAKQYGVDLENYATTEEAKIAIAEARAKAELKTQLDSGEISQEEYNARIGKITGFTSAQSTIDSILENAFTNFTFDFNGQIGIGSEFDEKTGMSDEQSKAWEELLKKHQRELDAIAHEKDLIQAEIDEAEAAGFIASEEYYKQLIALEQEEKASLIAKQKAMQDFYDANSAAMSADEIDEWNSEMRETALAIKEAENNMIEFGNTIEDTKWEYFENVREDIDGINEEIEFMHSLLEDEPVADENGNWSNEALTRLGLYTQQMEEAAYSAQDYQQKIDELNASTTDEEKNSDRYRDKLAELVDGQREAINSYEDAKDGIVELNEARVEAIKEGIEKEIEAYNDLLDVKREELDAERDLYDFKKNIEEQNKSIADTERKLAALSGSTAAEDVAERKRLEAQLVEQKGSLNDTYYDHSISAQQNALDEEGRYFEEAQQRRIESLEAMLENTEELIVNSMMDVMLNADTVHQTLNEQANTYGVTLSKELTQPWLDASAQAIAWRDELKRDMTEGEWATMIGEGGAITAFSNGVATKLGGSWDTAKTKAKAYSDFLTGNELKKDFSGAITTFVSYLQKIVDKWDEIRNAANAAVSVTPTVPSGGYTGGGDSSGGGGGGKTENPPKEKPKVKAMHADGQLFARTVVPTNLTSTHKTVDGVTYVPIPGTDYYVKKSDAPFGSAPYGTKKYKYYAKGTTGIDKDQWAITDEPQFGDELVLVPGKDGNLSFMRKGTGVVPADMTQKLFELAQIPTSDLMSKSITAIVPNITKNEFKNEFNFDSLVHVDHCDQNTLKDLEKMVDNKINQFGKQMNYALKGIK